MKIARFISIRFYYFLFFSAILPLFFTCENDPIDDKDSPKWEALGYGDRIASRLVIADPYLYVCGAIDGLWRKNVRQKDADWEYLGLADPAGLWSNGPKLPEF